MRYDIVGSIFLLLFVMIVGFIIEYWVYLVSIGVALAVIYGLFALLSPHVEAIDDFIEAKKREQERDPQSAILAQVEVDGGAAVLTRKELSKYDCYPCVLTLSHFDQDGRLTSSRATYLTCGDDEGRVVAGMRGSQPVYVKTRPKDDQRIISMLQADGTTVWQVYPQTDLTELTITAPHKWRRS